MTRSSPPRACGRAWTVRGRRCSSPCSADPDPALTQLAEERKRFDAHFQRAANNITEPTEGEIIESIRQDRDAYYRLVDAFLAQMRTSRRGASTTPAAPGMDAFDPGGNFIRLEALFHQLQADCANLVQVNQRAMVAKSEAAAGVARRWFLTTLAIAGSLILAGIGLAVVLADRIVRPLRSLTATMERVAGGDLDAKANVESHDEVGILAAGFNSMAERIRQLRRSDLGKLLVAQQTTEAAIDSLYNPVIVTDAQGGVTKLNPAAEEIFGPEPKNMGRARARDRPRQPDRHGRLRDAEFPAARRGRGRGFGPAARSGRGGACLPPAHDPDAR